MQKDIISTGGGGGGGGGHIKICIPELFQDVTILDIMNNNSKHFSAILPHLNSKQMLLNNRKRQTVVKCLPYKKILRLIARITSSVQAFFIL